MFAPTLRTGALAFALVLASTASAQRITSPEQQFGHPIGADYVLVNYQQLVEYWRKLDRESPRMRLTTIGKSAEGRDQVMAIVSSPDNLRRLDHYRGIAQRLALADGLTDEQARRLAAEGKAVVWIDGGLHATEVLGAQQLIESLYRLVSRNDPETLRILNDVIILFVHANPDGMDLVSDWYMQTEDPLRRTFGNIPRLYQKYIGHDNNRDFYASTQAETKNMNRAMYREWYPQIMYNHHQTAPRGTVMFAPPFRDPFNHHIDPLILQSLEMVGSNMHRRMIEEGKGGTTQRTGASFSTWWNGGLRTTAYFHNIIGILTETIGSPTPMRVPLVPTRLVPQGNLPMPMEPREWKFAESIEYSHTANMSILDLASRYRERFLYNIYQAGRNSIERGRQDSWTNYPSRVAAAQARASEEQETNFMQALKAPELRDPRGYIISADQPDFPTAIKFVNALIETGVQVHRATAPFTVGDKSYPRGSIVVRADQAFRPHVLDMFEPQDHPNDIPAPGAPPIPPYDNAGWTYAFQVGLQFDRILESFSGPFERVNDVLPPAPGLMPVGSGTHYVLSAAQNDVMTAVQRLQRAGITVARGGTDGAYYVPATPNSRSIIEGATRTLGIDATFGSQPADAVALQPIRVGLWDRYGGSMPSGWTRFIFENFEVPFNLVFPQELDAGNLREKYDVLVFVAGAIPGRDAGGAGGTSRAGIPSQFHHMLGNVTVANTVPRIKEFLEQGGTVVTIGSSTALAQHLGLPVEDHLVGANGRPLQRAEYYVPGSILRVRVNKDLPVAWGSGEYVDVMFDNSPVFKITDTSVVRPIAWFDTDKPLRSGWAWGQERLKDGVAMAEANVGQGKVYLFGPEVLFRSQPHGTFKFVFNAMQRIQR
jgi:hypothetical protein